MIRLKTAGLATFAAAMMMLMGTSVAPCAQGSGCVDSCRAAYGSCYKATSNREACQAQMQRCMQGCIASKGG